MIKRCALVYVAVIVMLVVTNVAVADSYEKSYLDGKFKVVTNFGVCDTKLVDKPVVSKTGTLMRCEMIQIEDGSWIDGAPFSADGQGSYIDYIANIYEQRGKIFFITWSQILEYRGNGEFETILQFESHSQNLYNSGKLENVYRTLRTIRDGWYVLEEKTRLYGYNSDVCKTQKNIYKYLGLIDRWLVLKDLPL